MSRWDINHDNKIDMQDEVIIEEIMQETSYVEHSRRKHEPPVNMGIRIWTWVCLLYDELLLNGTISSCGFTIFLGLLATAFLWQRLIAWAYR